MLTSFLIIAFLFFVIVVLSAGIYLLARPMVRGAIYYPTSRVKIDIAMQLAGVRAGEKIADLGSGDGRLLIAAAKRGLYATGYEINPVLVYQSRNAIYKADLTDHATVYWKSFWDADLGEFDTIVVYGIPYIMNALEKKMERELKPGTKIISNSFVFPGWKPLRKEGGMILYVWEGKKNFL